MGGKIKKEARVTERLAEGSPPSWLGLPLGAARAHDVVYGDVVVLRSPAAAGESLETTRVPVCERRLLNQKEVVYVQLIRHIMRDRHC